MLNFFHEWKSHNIQTRKDPASSRALLVGDWLAFLRHNVLEHMLSTLDCGPLQTNVQQIVGGPDILGKYELRVRI